MCDDPASTAPGQNAVSHADLAGGGTFFIERDGARVAEMTYRRIGESRVRIDHTWVDQGLRGKGVARKLLEALVLWARGTGTRVGATCSYAVMQFARDSSISDVRDEA